MDRLEASVRETIKSASVMGRTFWVGILGRLIGRDVTGDLHELVLMGMVESKKSSRVQGDEELVFKHALLRDAAYSLLTRRLRARLHEETAKVFAERRGTREALSAMQALCHMARLKSSVSLAKEAVVMAREIGFPSRTALALSTWGSLRLDAAAIEEARALVSADGTPHTYLQVLEDEARVKQSIEAAREGADLACEMGARATEQRFLQILSELTESTGGLTGGQDPSLDS